MKNGRTAACAALALMAGAASAQPIYDSVIRLGLFDAEHTQDGGFQNSLYRASDGRDLIAGTSNRYDGSSGRGNSA